MKRCGLITASFFGALASTAPTHVAQITKAEIGTITIPSTKTVCNGAGEVISTLSTANNLNAFHHTWTESCSTTPAATPNSIYTSTDISCNPSYVAIPTSSTSIHLSPTHSGSSVYVGPSISSSYVTPIISSVEDNGTTISSNSNHIPLVTTKAPTSTWLASSTINSTVASTSSSSTSSSSSGLAASGTSYTGDLTYYADGEGACGWYNFPSDHIVAISQLIYDNQEYKTANPNLNPLCGRYISITGVDGSQYQAKVVDRCTGCAIADLDLSEEFFNLVTDNGDGRVHSIRWTWV